MATKSQASLVLRKSVRPHHTVNIYTPHLAMRFESPPSPPDPTPGLDGECGVPLGGAGGLRYDYWNGRGGGGGGGGGGGVKLLFLNLCAGSGTFATGSEFTKLCNSTQIIKTIWHDTGMSCFSSKYTMPQADTLISALVTNTVTLIHYDNKY